MTSSRPACAVDYFLATAVAMLPCVTQAEHQPEPSRPPQPAEWMAGADVSSLALLEDNGAVYRDADGREADAIALLTEQGVNWFRLRLFVDPNGEQGVVNNLAYTTALARRIESAGGHWLLDLHYSDTWADPGKQFKPAAWAELPFEELVGTVRQYTRDVLEHFEAAGLRPNLVQVGNEISNGMLWPDGKLWGPEEKRDAEFDRFAQLLQAGIGGVRDVVADRSALPVMLHLDRGDDWDLSRTVFGKLTEQGVAFEVIGFSYYPRFHGSLDEVRNNFNRTAAAFGKPVVLVECGFAYRGGEHEPQLGQFRYPVSPQGQAAFTRDVVQAVREVPDGLGRGVFWWHAAAVPTPSRLAWHDGRLGLFDAEGRVLPAAAELAPKSQTRIR